MKQVTNFLKLLSFIVVTFPLLTSCDNDLPDPNVSGELIIDGEQFSIKYTEIDYYECFHFGPLRDNYDFYYDMKISDFPFFKRFQERKMEMHIAFYLEDFELGTGTYEFLLNEESTNPPFAWFSHYLSNNGNLSAPAGGQISISEQGGRYVINFDLTFEDYESVSGSIETNLAIHVNEPTNEDDCN
ncbi:MAG: hypothetical protein ABJG47_17975 [Ekhidna sp.]